MMKQNRAKWTALFAVMTAVGIGCTNVKRETDTSFVNNNDNTDTPDASVDKVPLNTSNCDQTKICAALSDPKDCIAAFELGTAQAGVDGTYADATGFYGYNDLTPGAVMEPKRNNEGSEPATEAATCDPNGLYALHVSGSGFMDWGAGIGLDWGGEANPNPDCESEEARKCKEISDADPNFLIADAEADPRCRDENGAPDPVKMRCVIHGKNYKMHRDLSDYRGIGFWIARTDESSDVLLKVNFGVPETTRFLADPTLKAEYRRTDGEFAYEGGCSDDDGDDTTKCYDEFTTNIRLANTDIGKWVYVEVLFSELATSGWGIALPFSSFPSNRSVGMKIQTTGPDTYFDFYIDDIHLIR